MKPNIQAILDDCIERGILSALVSKEDEWSDERLADHIHNRIWCEIDLYFDFEE